MYHVDLGFCGWLFGYTGQKKILRTTCAYNKLVSRNVAHPIYFACSQQHPICFCAQQDYPIYLGASFEKNDTKSLDPEDKS